MVSLILRYIEELDCKTEKRGPIKLRIKKGFIAIVQLGVLWLIYQVGSMVVQYLHMPIPGNVWGMIILFMPLVTGVIKLEWIDGVASFLLKHLVFFFNPLTVVLMLLATLLTHH